MHLDKFTWKRPASRHRGFAWQETGGMALVDGADLVEYEPDLGLHRTFALGVEPTQAAILGFADKYGALRDRYDLCHLGFWRDQIAEMRRAITLSTALASKSLSKVRENLLPLYLPDVPAMRDIKAKLDAGAKLSDAETAIAATLHLTYFAREAVSRLSPVATWNAKERTVTLRLQPPDLLDVLWLQFAHALNGGHRYLQCAGCLRWFQVNVRRGARQARSDREICSQTCKVTMSLRRKRRARELHAEGWTVPQIADEVKSDQNQVRKWISS
jgi:hypothetical protein